jgi:hypothetical protein
MNSLYAFKIKRFRNTSPQSNIWNAIVKFFKHPVLPVEVSLNRNYPR